MPKESNSVGNVVAGAETMAVLAMKHRDDDGPYALSDVVAQADGRHADRFLPEDEYALIVHWQSGGMHHEDWFKLTNHGTGAYIALDHIDQPDWI